MEWWMAGRLLVGALACCSSAPASASSDFDATLRTHLQAIEQRDLEGLLATVAEQPEPTLIFPNGQLLRGKQAFRDVHVAWFADDQWRIEFSEVSRSVGNDLASVLLRYELRDEPEPGQGNPRSTYLALVFRKVDGQWLLVHDQNTRIQPPAS